MSITRKEFFRQGLLSLGKTALDLAGTMKGETAPAIQELPADGLPLAEPDGALVACPDNARCLARSCGCFACVERCEPQAILMVPGEGIRVDQARCFGCGTCEYVCPVTPKAIALISRNLQE